MTAYYNEFDPKAAAWLRELIKQGHIADGVVDERSIEDVTPNDLHGFTQCHFFAGIGVWSYALRQSGWADDRPVWTGSCPCQPFSAAGKGAGFTDERHLWPAFHHLISQCRPDIVFGEQVASKDGLVWLDLVQSDLEATGYASGAVDLCAAGVGAPHIRQRLWWVAERLADSFNAGSQGRLPGWQDEEWAWLGHQHGSAAIGLADADGGGYAQLQREGSGGLAERGDEEWTWLGHEHGSAVIGMADATSGGHMDTINGSQRGKGVGQAQSAGGISSVQPQHPSPTNGFWGVADWLFCRDGKWRPVVAKPQPLADGSARSLGRVRDEFAENLKEKINAWSVENKISGTQGLRDLLIVYGEKAASEWPIGGIPRLCETPFLLSFLRQLEEQGWRKPECLSVSCEEVVEAIMRSVWVKDGIAGASRQHGLEGQSAREYSDALSLLSSLLAWGAREAWGVSYDAYAETQHPLTNKAANRVMRLKGYGNAIVAQAAQAFIESVM